MFGSLCELREFVRNLDVPEARREVVEAELLDHFFARVADGASEIDALAAFGAPEALAIRFESCEQTFAFRRRDALRDAARLGIGFAVSLAAATTIISLIFEALHRVWVVDHASGAETVWLWAFMRHTVPALIWSLSAGIPLACLLVARPARRRSTAGTVAIERGATATFLLVACGLGLASALRAEDLMASGLTHIGIDGAGPDEQGRLLVFALWLLQSSMALLHVPLTRRRRGRLDYTSTI